MHIATAVADSFAPIRLVDAFVPFAGAYRPIWLGLGTVASDLLVALVVTSLLRERIGYRVWRGVHWAAYASWPIALVHGLGTGSDTRARWAVLVNVTCLAIVLTAVLVRIGWTRTTSGARRAVAALGSLVLAAGTTAWMLAEPMRPGWARKAGTPSALLASAPAVGSPPAAPRSASVTAIPMPFTSATRGSLRRSTGADGLATVTIDTRLPAAHDARLRVVIAGTALSGGGVSMQRSTVQLGLDGAPNLYRGAVAALDGTSVRASVRAPGGARAVLVMDFSIDRANVVTGTVSGRSEAGTR